MSSHNLSRIEIDELEIIGYYLSHRNFCGQSAGTILAPENLLAPMRDIIEALSCIGRSIRQRFQRSKPISLRLLCLFY